MMPMSMLCALSLIGIVSAQRYPASNETHFMCDGTDYDKEEFNEPNAECCGPILFDPNTKICFIEFDESSAKLIFSLKDAGNGGYGSICGDQVYDAKKNVCCSDQVVVKETHLLYDLFPRCCKMKQYDVQIHVCCQSTGTLLEIPTRGASDVYVRTDCCNKELFTNHSYQACCSDKLIDRPLRGRSYCCGSELLTDVTQELCCGDVIHKRSEYPRMECCKGFFGKENEPLTESMYNKETHTCCLGHVYESGMETECSKFHKIENPLN